MRIDPTKIIDREGEAEVFRKLITLGLPRRRVLVVSAPNGMGKTELLRKFRLLADLQPEVAVAYVSLSDFSNLPDTFAIIEAIYTHLAHGGVKLKTFETLNGARRLKSTLEFLNLLKTTSAYVDLQNSIVSGAPKIAALMINAEHFELPPWDEEADVQARWVCAEAFFADLTECIAQRSVVLLFDGIEKVGDDLRSWVVSEFVRQRALTDWAQRKLFVVVAGSQAEQLVLGRLPDDQKELVEPLPPFTPWDEDHVRQCLEANDIKDTTNEEVLAGTMLLKAGHNLVYVLTQVSDWVSKRRVQ